MMGLLKKWCDRTWLYAVYFLGVVMGCTLIWNWGSWEQSQKLVCILAIMVPMHIFEENSFPAGFYFMNNMGFHSKEPIAVFLILLPFAISIKVKSKRFAFDDKGYFEKYDR